MKTSTLFLSCAALLQSAVAQDSFLWTIDHGTVKHSSGQSISISSDTARSIIAQRRGMTSDRYLQVGDNNTLAEINKFGGYQQPLFAAGTAKKPARILIRISGFEGSASQFSVVPDLWVEKSSRDLLDDFKARTDANGICEYSLSVPGKSNIDIVYSYYSDDSLCRTTQEIDVVPAIITILSAVPTTTDMDNDMSALLQTLSHLSTTEDLESTILVLPPSDKLSRTNTRRSAQSEEPLDLPFGVPPVAGQDTVDSSQSNDTRPLPKNVPHCFFSEKACNNGTNSCSNRGSCVQAHAGCFQCKCIAQVLVESDAEGRGRKTIQWGGNACQKKDISVPFAMFSVFAIVVTALVAGSIGMLFSMGSQELPSVLGAGVSGPRAQK